MKILYDHQAFFLQTYGGISRLFAETAKNLTALEQRATLSVLLADNAHLRETGMRFPAVLKVRSRKKRELLRRVNNRYTRFRLSQNRHDIYHPTYYDPSFCEYSRRKPIVVTVFDMIHELFRDRFQELNDSDVTIRQKREIVERAHHVIAISESTKKDLIELYGLAAEKISVVYLGSSFQSDGSASDGAPPSRPYLLFVGNRTSYKNWTPLLEAISEVLIRTGVALVCAGGARFSQAELELISRLGLSGLVSQEPIDDRKLARLYSQAIAFLFPSLYEGFGIPVLEAFACNCPCVLSNSSSLPEVGGDAALYMDPTNLDSMRMAVTQVIENRELRGRLAAKGKARVQEFSWQRSAAETLEVYRNL